MPRTTAFGWYPRNFLGLCERLSDHLAEPPAGLPRERLWQVRAKEVVLATGAIERPLPFPDNDRPGIMMAEAARSYVNRYAALPGTRAVVATSTDSAYRVALDLHAAGVEIAAIADMRSSCGEPWLSRVRRAGIDVRHQTRIAGTRGRTRITSASLAPTRGAERQETIACDLLLMSAGMTPSIHLFSQSKGRTTFDSTLQAYIPAHSLEHERSAGACRGIYHLSAAMADGYNAGAIAAKRACDREAPLRQFAVAADDLGPLELVTSPASSKRSSRVWIDFQNDVTLKDIQLAAREGFESIEHIKRYTTTGMATDQGKTSNMNALTAAAQVLSKQPSDIGLTTFRPPYTPTTFGVFAGQSRGELFDPVRLTPIHDWATAKNAIFEDVGLWKRARYFPIEGESMGAAVARECRTVRTTVGMLDASTLGKIEVVGPDAAEFLNRIYINDVSRLEPGRTAYSVVLREDGFILDDGIVARLAADRFYVTTTTGGAHRVSALMEDYLQTEWSHLSVWLTPVTEQWTVVAVQGPKARATLEARSKGSSCLPCRIWLCGRVGYAACPCDFFE
jgi:sarcosine oxidase subunit alpha